MKASKFRWLVIGMVFIITVINYVDRSAIAFAMPILSKQFNLSVEDIGLTLGAFNIGYAVLVIFGGLMVDRWGSRKLWPLIVLIWSLSIFSSAFATGFAMLFTVRLLLGLGEGPHFTALNRTVADWLPSKERGVALANALVAVPLALMLGGPIVANLSVKYSWQGMFMILGGIGIIWAPLWYFFYHDFPEHSKYVNDLELIKIRETSSVSRNLSEKDIRRVSHSSTPGMWKYLLTNPTLLSNDWGFFVLGYNLFFFMGWLPTYLSKAYGMNLQQVGNFTILPWAMGAIMLYGVGYLSDRIFRTTGSLRYARSYPIWISQLLGALSLLPVIMFHSLIMSAVFISLAVGFNMASNSTFFAVNMDVIKQKSATAAGIMDCFFSVAGLLASTLTGFIVQLTGSFSAVFILVIALNISSVLGVLFFHHPDKKANLGIEKI